MDELRKVCPDLDKYIDIIAKNARRLSTVRLSNMNSEQLSAADSITSCIDKMSDWKKIIYGRKSIYIAEVVARYIFERWKKGDITLDELRIIRDKIDLKDDLMIVVAILITNEENGRDEETVNKAAALANESGGYFTGSKEMALYANKFTLDAFRRLKVKCTSKIGYLISAGIAYIENKAKLEEWISFFSKDDLVNYLKLENTNDKATTRLLSSLLIDRVGLEAFIDIYSRSSIDESPSIAQSILYVTLRRNV